MISKQPESSSVFFIPVSLYYAFLYLLVVGLFSSPFCVSFGSPNIFQQNHSVPACFPLRNSCLLSKTLTQKDFSPLLLPSSLVRVSLCFTDASGCTGSATEFTEAFHTKVKTKGQGQDKLDLTWFAGVLLRQTHKL